MKKARPSRGSDVKIVSSTDLFYDSQFRPRDILEGICLLSLTL